MRDTVYCLMSESTKLAGEEAVTASMREATVAKVKSYVPGYRMKQKSSVPPALHR